MIQDPPLRPHTRPVSSASALLDLARPSAPSAPSATVTGAARRARIRELANPEEVSLAGRIRRRLLGIPARETRAARRGFDVRDPSLRQRLEAIGLAFLSGYHAALECGDARGLASRLEGGLLELRGFAFEGAGMALLLLDALLPFGGGRWLRFARGDGAPHLYMVHVGAGWALARLPGVVARRLVPPDPLLRWLAWDGWGFHDGYFHRETRVKRQRVPRALAGYARRAYDQGLGRSLWFGDGADPERIAAAIAAFDPARRADLWSGAGLAAAYAGGVPREALETLRDESADHRLHLAQGAAFAARARERAGNPAAHTALACEVLCGTDVGTAARMCDEALEGLAADGAEPAYESWRGRVRARLPHGGRA